MDSSQRTATLLAILLGISGFVGFTLNAPQVESPTFRVIAELDNLITPGVHRVSLKVYSNSPDIEITGLTARLTQEGFAPWQGGSATTQVYFYEDFPEVSSTSPMSYGDHVTRIIWESGSSPLDSDVLLSCTLANGEKFDVATKMDWVRASVQPAISISANFDKPENQNPGGPTIIVTIQSLHLSQPISQLSVTFKHINGVSPGVYYNTMDFQSVSQSNPLLSGGLVSQKYGWVGFSQLGSEAYLFGTLADGTRFNVTKTIVWR
jgi:hypothetical protein